MWGFLVYKNTSIYFCYLVELMPIKEYPGKKQKRLSNIICFL
jgi:hypothetical protein